MRYDKPLLIAMTSLYVHAEYGDSANIYNYINEAVFLVVSTADAQEIRP